MARARNIGNVYAELSLKDSMSAALKKGRKALNDFGKTGLKTAAVGVGAFAAGTAAAMAVGTKRTLSMADDLADTAAQTGVAIGEMMQLQRAYEDGGRSASMAGADISRMQKAIVAATKNPAADPFAAMGLSAQQLLALSPAQQFEQIGAAIMAIQNPAERNAKAMEIFGKAGSKLVTVFGGLPNAVRALGRMPELAERFAGSMGEANDLVGHLPLKADQFFMGFTSGIIGQLLPGLQKIDDYDFTTLGENLGIALSTAFETITDGTMWEIFTLQGEKAIATINTSPTMSAFAAGINTLWDGLVIHTHTGQNDFDWSGVFEKYYNSGQDANIDLIDDLDARIQDLKNAAGSRAAEKRRAAEAVPVTIAEPIPVWKPDPVFSTKAAQFDPYAREVNDYQRRGLALDAYSTGGQTTKTESILEAIRGILVRAQNSKEPLRI